MIETEIQTDDGRCPSYVFRPEGKGPWPAVLFFMDGIGIRPAMFDMAQRLSAQGYFVLLPDLYYRAGRYEPMDARTLFSDPEKLKVLREKFFSMISVAKTMSDVKSFLAFLDAQPDVKRGGIGTTGYCMGGRMSIVAAGTYPDRVVAAAAYHPGGLVTDAPDSPHLLAPKMKARVYIAGAIEDANFTDEQKARLDDALTKAGVDHVVETYPAKHGWVPGDTPVHDAVCAERHWKSLLALLDAKLKG
jgi:carboxymethylenebutenolidase